MWTEPTLKRIPSWQGYRGSIFYGDSSLPAPLLDRCFQAFSKYNINISKDIDFDKEQPAISKEQIPKALLDIGLLQSEEELNNLLQHYGTKSSIDFEEFCRMVRSIRETFIHTTHSEQMIRQQNILEAWVCCGGQKDKTGSCSVVKMKNLLSTLGLLFDVDGQLEKLDIDGDGKVDFYEFQQLFKEV